MVLVTGYVKFSDKLKGNVTNALISNLEYTLGNLEGIM